MEPSPSPSLSEHHHAAINDTTPPHEILTLTDYEEDVVFIVRIVVASLSLLGAAIAVALMLIYRRYNHRSTRLILALLVTACVEGIDCTLHETVEPSPSTRPRLASRIHCFRIDFILFYFIILYFHEIYCFMICFFDSNGECIGTLHIFAEPRVHPYDLLLLLLLLPLMIVEEPILISL